MPMHDAIRGAIDEVVSSMGQSDRVSKRLNTWLDCLADGNCSLDNADDVQSRIETVLEKISVSDEQAFPEE